MRFRFGLILILAITALDTSGKPLPPFSGQFFLDNVDYTSSHYYFRANLRNVSGSDNVIAELRLPTGVSLLHGSMQWRGQIAQGGIVDINFVLYVPKGASLDNALELTAIADNGVRGLIRYTSTSKLVAANTLKSASKTEKVTRYGRALRVVRLK